MATEFELGTGTLVTPTTGDRVFLSRSVLGVPTPYAWTYETIFAPLGANAGTSTLAARSDHTHATYVAKVSGGTAGHLAVLTSDGSISDGGANVAQFTLQPASISTIGGVKQGSGTSIANDGTISIPGSTVSSLPALSTLTTALRIVLADTSDTLSRGTLAQLIALALANDGSIDLATLTPLTSPPSDLVVQGISNGAPVTVLWSGMVGSGGSTPTPTPTAPSQVGSLTAGTPTSTTIPVTYTAPTGTAPITYAGQTSPHGAGTWTTNGGTFSATGGTFTGLTASTAYDLRIIATNSTGSSTTTLTNVSDASTGGTVTGHRYWSVNVTSNPGNGFVAIGELSMATSAGGANVLTGGTPSASTTYTTDPGYTPDKAIDGTATTLWSGDSVLPARWIYDFGSGVTPAIAELKITARNNSGVSQTIVTNSSPTAFSIDWSDDGTTWHNRQIYNAASWTAGSQQTFVVPASDVAQGTLLLASPTYAAGKFAQGLSGGTGTTVGITLPLETRAFGFWLTNTSGLGSGDHALINASGFVATSDHFSQLEMDGSSSNAPPSDLGDGGAHWCYFERRNDGATHSYDNGASGYQSSSVTQSSPVTFNFNMSTFGGAVLSDVTVWNTSDATRATPPTTSLAGVTTGNYGTGRVVTWALNGSGASS